MSENSIQDDYIDLMLHLAFHMEAEDEAQLLLKQESKEWTDADARSADNAYLSAWVTAEEHRKVQTAANRKQHIRRILLQGGKAAACLIIALALAFPVALAASAEFRSYVMKLMMVWDQTKGEAYFSFIKQEENSFIVPEEWEGEWYPSFIPSDLELLEIHSDMNIAEYAGSNPRRQMWFNEMDEHDDVMLGTEGTAVSSIMINGMSGWIVGNDDEAVSLVWGSSDKWFSVISFNLTPDEVIRIAESVRKIIS